MQREFPYIALNSLNFTVGRQRECLNESPWIVIKIKVLPSNSYKEEEIITFESTFTWYKNNNETVFFFTVTHL